MFHPALRQARLPDDTSYSSSSIADPEGSLFARLCFRFSEDSTPTRSA